MTTGSPVPRKRTAEEASILDWFVSRKFGRLVPASMDLSCYMSLKQDPEERLFDHRALAGTRGTHPDDQVLPIWLIYEPFGTFIDTYLCTGRSACCASPSLRGQVDDFADKMTQIYASENHRRDAALSYLDLIFSEALGETLTNSGS